ncbi:MAG: pitrilysin family protein, partial [Planctomycetota bacterium]|nr:pitrilysin family protein [Planctomycetota bacterium]
MEFRNSRLENGLEIVAECNPHAYSTSLAFFVRAGARDEPESVSGVSHFLEHMVFKGTPTRSAADVNLELDELGANSNAYTSEEQTVYYATVLPELQSQTTQLLADIMRPELRDSDFETEKKVIIEEIRKYDDQPPYGAHEKCMALFFQGHPLANSILGTEKSVGALTVAQMRDYFRARYSPSNIVFAAAGRVDFDRLERDLEKWCGTWEPFITQRSASSARHLCASRQERREQATQQYIIQIGAAPDATDPQRYANRLLTMIVGDDTSSRLYWDLVDSGRAEYAGISSHEFQGAGMNMSYLCCEPDDASENLQRVLDVQRQVESEFVTAEELELAKNKACSHVVLRAERPSSRMFSVGNGWIQRRSYLTVAETV